MIFNKTIRMHYRLFGFQFYYTIMCLYFLDLAGLPDFGPRVQVGPGPETCGPGRAGPGLGLNSSLRAWAGLGLTIFCGPGLDCNC